MLTASLLRSTCTQQPRSSAAQAARAPPTMPNVTGGLYSSCAMRCTSCASSSIMYASDAPRRRWRYIVPPVQLLLLLLLLLLLVAV
jgi:hypothetical protein